jgi:hypothetical protein
MAMLAPLARCHSDWELDWGAVGIAWSYTLVVLMVILGLSHGGYVYLPTCSVGYER